MASIGSLAVQITAGTAGLAAGMSKAKGLVSGFAGGISGAFGALAGVGAALGITNLVNDFVGMVREQMNVVENTLILADTLGIGTEELVALQHAASLANVESETLSKGLMKLGKFAGEAAFGEDAALQKLNDLGIAADEFVGKSLDQQFMDVATAIRGLPEQQQIAAAMDVMGKGGAAMLPLIRDSAVGMDVLIAKAKELGLTFSRDEAVRVDEANDAITRLQSSFTGIARQAAIEFAPLVETFATMFGDLVSQGGGMKEIFQGIVVTISAVVVAVMDLIVQLGRLMADIIGAKESGDAFVKSGFVQTFFAKPGQKMLGFLGSETKMLDSDPAWLKVIGEASNKTKDTINRLTDQFAPDDEAVVVWKEWTRQAEMAARASEGASKAMREGIIKRMEELGKFMDQNQTPLEDFEQQMVSIAKTLGEDTFGFEDVEAMAVFKAFEKLEGGLKEVIPELPKAMVEGSGEALSAIARAERLAAGGETPEQRVERVLKGMADKQQKELDTARQIRDAIEKQGGLRRAEF